MDILNLIYETAQNTAPVTVQIGYTVDNICHKGIVIKEAPPAIIDKLIEYGYICNLKPDGLHVYKL
jgi:hypothetical protein